MADSIMYQEDSYVVLAANKPEEFMTPEALLEKLQGILQTRQDNLPRDLQQFNSLEDQAKHLRDTACELDMEGGDYLQWYIVRLSKD